MGIRVLLADDHHLVRECIKLYLESVAVIELVVDTGSSDAIVSLYKEVRPDVVLMDIKMPERNGIQVCGDLLDIDEHAKILFLTAHSDIEYVSSAVKCGAKGLINKNIEIDGLTNAIEVVFKGGYFYRSFATKESKNHDLTPREVELIRCLIKGLSTNEISEQMFISPKTVNNHKTSIFKKLDVRNSVELTMKVLENGLFI